MAAQQTYTVISGDNLSKIAAKYQISVASILQANPKIKNPNIIKVGDKITIPVPAISSTVIPKVTKAPPTPSATTTAKAGTSVGSFFDAIKQALQNIVDGVNKAVEEEKAIRLQAGSSRLKGTFDTVKFSWNPESITDAKGNNYDYTDPSNNANQILHFKSGKVPTLKFDLYVSEREEAGSVSRMINKLNSHIPYGTNKANFAGLPPKPMIFSFGKLYVKTVFLEDFEIKRTRFGVTDLSTTEATITVSLLIVE
jgi:LysM repeat protein